MKGCEKKGGKKGWKKGGVCKRWGVQKVGCAKNGSVKKMVKKWCEKMV